MRYANYVLCFALIQASSILAIQLCAVTEFTFLILLQQ